MKAGAPLRPGARRAPRVVRARTGSAPRSTSTSCATGGSVKVATTKAQRKLFFNLRSMKTYARPRCRPSEARAIAKDLGVKPEEVVEMETRLVGPRHRARPAAGRGRRVGARRSRISPTPTTSPRRSSSARETARNRADGLQRALAKLDDRSRRIIEARWLREDDRRDAAGARRRVRRLGRAHPPDRRQGAEDDAEPDRSLTLAVAAPRGLRSERSAALSCAACFATARPACRARRRGWSGRGRSRSP